MIAEPPLQDSRKAAGESRICGLSGCGRPLKTNPGGPGLAFDVLGVVRKGKAGGMRRVMYGTELGSQTGDNAYVRS